MNIWLENTYDQFSLRLDTLPHAILIHGPRGLGKLALAKSFAQRILCEQGDAGPCPCGRCDGCRWFLSEKHPDYRQVEPEALTGASDLEEENDRPAAAQKKKPSTEIKIDQVRELADFLNIGSHRARRRIALFHPAEAMNLNAANALLKSLEEPAPGACFILVSHQPAPSPAYDPQPLCPFPVRTPDLATGIRWLTERALDPRGVACACRRHRWQQWTCDLGGRRRIAGWRSAGHREPSILPSAAVTDREQLEPLVELLQNGRSISRRRLAAPGRYGLPPPTRFCSIPEARRWLEFSRRLARAQLDAHR